MGRYKITALGKVVIMLIVLAVVGGGIFAGMKAGLIKPKKNEPSKVESTSESKANTDNKQSGDKGRDDTTSTTTTENTNEINLSLDEWIGWKSIIDANGNLTTEAQSIFDQKGIKVNIHVINDATQSSNALIKGDLDGAGYTINRTAFLSKKFTDAGVDVIMPIVTNYSNGGDGIIASTKYQTVDSLVDAKIGIPQFSEAQTLVMYLLNQSDLTDEQRNQIISNFVYFETPDEVAKAFFSGHIDVAATWEPYLTQARTTSNCHVLFSTASSRNLIMDGIVFRKDFAEANPETIQKFIDGVLEASNLYATDFTAIKNVFPMYAGSDDQEIKEATMNADLCTWKDNMDVLSDNAKTIYTNMCEIWSSVGESVNTDMVDTLFDTSYMEALSDKYNTLSVTETKAPESQKTVVKVTDENREQVLNTEALLAKKVTVNFVANTCNFMDNAEASASLEEFIEVAKTLDGTIIQIEGNVATDNTTEAEQLLSEQRAETIKKYFIANGIDGNRILTIGNGGSKPVMPNHNPDGSLSKEATDANRRTDIYFKIVEVQ